MMRGGPVLSARQKKRKWNVKPTPAGPDSPIFRGGLRITSVPVVRKETSKKHKEDHESETESKKS